MQRSLQAWNRPQHCLPAVGQKVEWMNFNGFVHCGMYDVIGWIKDDGTRIDYKPTFWRPLEEEKYLVQVIIESGGIIRDIQVPDNVKVIVKDYDTGDNACFQVIPGTLKKDKDGDEYIETIWENT